MRMFLLLVMMLFLSSCEKLEFEGSFEHSLRRIAISQERIANALERQQHRIGHAPWTIFRDPEGNRFILVTPGGQIYKEDDYGRKSMPDHEYSAERDDVPETVL